MSVGFVIAFVSHLGVRPEPGEILRMQHKHVLCIALRFHGFDLATRHILYIIILYAETDPDFE